MGTKIFAHHFDVMLLVWVEEGDVFVAGYKRAAECWGSALEAFDVAKGLKVSFRGKDSIDDCAADVFYLVAMREPSIVIPW